MIDQYKNVLEFCIKREELSTQRTVNYVSKILSDNNTHIFGLQMTINIPTLPLKPPLLSQISHNEPHTPLW